VPGLEMSFLEKLYFKTWRLCCALSLLKESSKDWRLCCTELDVVAMCGECLKDFTVNLMIDAKTFANLKDRAKGIEYLKGKKNYTAESDESSLGT
jgi:hypothetical protein